MWYAYEDSKDDKGWFNEIPVKSDLTAAVKFVHGLVRQEHNLGIPYGGIVIAGYSQGATLALEAGLRFPWPLGLVFAERGIVLSSRLKCSENILPTPYIMTAGKIDDKYGAWRVKQGWTFQCRKHIPSFYEEIAGLRHIAAS